MHPHSLKQGTESWLNARCGSLGASSFSDAVAKIKTGWGASRFTLQGRLIAERLTGRPAETYKSAAMRWGNEIEPEARAYYQFMYDVEVAQIGLVRHPRILGSHASPDGLIGSDGLLEIKAPETSTHINTLMSEKIDRCYFLQTMWQMACTGRQWVDYISYDPRMPDELQMFIKRVERNEALIKEMEEQAAEFVADLETKLAQLCEKRGIVAPPPAWLRAA